MAHIIHITADPEEAWLLDGDTKPQNVIGNVGGSPAGIPVFRIGEHPDRARNHVKALIAAWDQRVAAAQKVAQS